MIFLKRWNGFWFAEGEARNLGICRILFFLGISVLSFSYDFRPWSQVPQSIWFPISIFKWFEIPPLSLEIAGFLQQAWQISSLFACLGLLTRVSMATSAITMLMLMTFHYSHGFVHHPYQILSLLSIILMFSDAGRCFALDLYVFKQNPVNSEKSSEYGWPIKFIWLSWSLMYFAAAVSKLTLSGFAWVLSDNLRSIIHHNSFYFGTGLSFGRVSAPLGIALAQWPLLCKILAGFVLVLELLAPLILLHVKLRVAIVVFIALLQIGNYFVLSVDFRSQLVCYVFFVPWERVYNFIVSKYASRVKEIHSKQTLLGVFQYLKRAGRASFKREYVLYTITFLISLLMFFIQSFPELPRLVRLIPARTGLFLLVRPFSQARQRINGEERTQFKCIFPGGEKSFGFDQEILSKIPGPHRRKIYYIGPLTASSGRIGFEALEKNLRNGFCQNGTLAVASGCPANVTEIQMSVRDVTGLKFYDWSVKCQK